MRLRFDAAGDVDQRQHAEQVRLHERLDDVQQHQRHRHEQARDELVDMLGEAQTKALLETPKSPEK